MVENMKSRSLRPAVLLAFIAALALPAVAQNTQNSADHLLHILKHAVEGKYLVMRHAYPGNRLEFGPDGSVMGSPQRGTWAVDSAFHVTRVSMDGPNAKIEGDRIVVYYGQKNDLRAVPEYRPLTVEMPFPADATTEAAVNATLEHVFFGADEKGWPPPPPMRKEYRSAKYEFREGKKPVRTKGSADWKEQKDIQEPLEIGELANGQNLYLVSKAVTPPKPIKTPDPPYPEGERQQAHQGTSKLTVIVDSAGNVSNMRIDKSAGRAFDDEAARAVSEWQFDPARLNGQPVAVLITVELNFRLY